MGISALQDMLGLAPMSRGLRLHRVRRLSGHRYSRRNLAMVSDISPTGVMRHKDALPADEIEMRDPRVPPARAQLGFLEAQ